MVEDTEVKNKLSRKNIKVQHIRRCCNIFVTLFFFISFFSSFFCTHFVCFLSFSLIQRYKIFTPTQKLGVTKKKLK